MQGQRVVTDAPAAHERYRDDRLRCSAEQRAHSGRVPERPHHLALRWHAAQRRDKRLRRQAPRGDLPELEHVRAQHAVHADEASHHVPSQIDHDRLHSRLVDVLCAREHKESVHSAAQDAAGAEAGRCNMKKDLHILRPSRKHTRLR